MTPVTRFPLFLLFVGFTGAIVAAPPLIPLESFFKAPAFDRVTLSPNGNMVGALAATADGRMNLYVLDLVTKQPKPITGFTDKDVNSYRWLSNDRLLFTVAEDGYGEGGLFAVDIDGGRLRVLAETVPQQINKGAYIYRHTEYLGRAGDREDEILVLNNDRREFDFDVYRMNTRHGRKTMVARNPGQVSAWVADSAGQVRAAFGQEGLERFVLYREDNGADWREVRRRLIGEGEILPLAFDAGDRELLVLSNVNRDTWEVRRFDPRAGELGEVIHALPDYDMSDVVTDRVDHRLLGVTYEAEKPAVHWVDPAVAELQGMIDESLPDTLNVIYSVSEDRQKVIIRAASDRDAGSFFLLDLSKMTMELLVSRAPWLKPEHLAEMRPINYSARDGRRIPGYLTLPAGRGEGPFPLVVNPHGGPWVRDSWGYIDEVQFLANRGYAVLQMNFRGSTGYGRDHLEAGYGQWGLAMQDDITDGVNWAIAEGHADPERVAIYGASYGGYATMAGLTFTPELYRCGVNYVGVTDIALLLRTIPDAWESSRQQLEAMTGNAKIDRERLDRTSPLKHVANIQAPLLLAYGELDERVDIKHAQALVAELKRHDKPHEYMVKFNEGHGFYRQDNRFEFYTALERFLAEHMK